MCYQKQDLLGSVGDPRWFFIGKFGLFIATKTTPKLGILEVQKSFNYLVQVGNLGGTHLGGDSGPLSVRLGLELGQQGRGPW